jgi:hypothetical protein
MDLEPWTVLIWAAIIAAPATVGVLAMAWAAIAGGFTQVTAQRAAAAPPTALWLTAPKDCGTATEKEQRIGIILVHGIGEQRRFQHLDSQLRDLIRSLRSLQDAGVVLQVSVDIAGSGAAAFSAEHDTWTSGPGSSVTIVVNHTLNNERQRARLLVHEVWWADVNEPYSLAKQFRFWLWGLAMWAIPTRPQSNLGSADRVAPPVVDGRSWCWDRLRLWMVGVFFMLLGYSTGAASFLASRLFNCGQCSLPSCEAGAGVAGEARMPDQAALHPRLLPAPGSNRATMGVDAQACHAQSMSCDVR